MEYPVAHRLHGGVVQVEKVALAAGQHGDAALIGQMDAAGHRQFHHADARFGGDGGEVQNLVTAQGGHLDPAGPFLHVRQDVAQHPFRHGGRRQAGDDVIDRGRKRLGTGPRGWHRGSARAGFRS